MLRYVCLLYLATAAFAQVYVIPGQQAPSALTNPGIAMPNIPAGASVLGTVAASAGQQQPQQGVPVLGAVNGQSFFQQTAPFGASPMYAPGPVMQAQQPIAGSPVPPPSGGPLASLAAQQTLANSLVRTQGPSSGFNPLLFALGGGNDNMLPMLLMSQPGLFQKNPLMGMMMMNNM